MEHCYLTVYPIRIIHFILTSSGSCSVAMTGMSSKWAVSTSFLAFSTTCSKCRIRLWYFSWMSQRSRRQYDGSKAPSDDLSSIDLVSDMTKICFLCYLVRSATDNKTLIAHLERHLVTELRPWKWEVNCPFSTLLNVSSISSKAPPDK